MEVRGGSRTAATSKVELFVIIVNGLTIITKSSTLDVAAAPDPPLEVVKRRRNKSEKQSCFSNYFFQLEIRKKRE